MTDAPKFPLRMPVWTNAAGILRPDQADGRPAPWFVSGVRLLWTWGEDGEATPAGFEYHLDSPTRPAYGWVSEAELASAEYPAKDDADVLSAIAHDADGEHPELIDRPDGTNLSEPSLDSSAKPGEYEAIVNETETEALASLADVL